MNMNMMRFLLVAMVALCGVSCVGIYSSETPTAYGTAKRQLYAQAGMKNTGIELPQGGSMASADGEKNFGQAATLVGTGLTVNAWGAVEKAKAGATAATTQTGIKAGAATEQARIQATERAATALGGNPEANVGAVDAVGRVFAR